MSQPSLYDPKTLEAILPHRRPFLFVDRVVLLEPGCRIGAEMDLKPEAGYFNGHFPGRPVMPGVLITEAMAQTSGLLLGLTRLETERRLPNPAPILYLAAVNVKFTRTALPGQILTLRSEALGAFAGLFRFQVECEHSGELVATGHLTLADPDLRPSGP